MVGLVPTATHPIDESYIELKPETEHKFTEFIILSSKEVEQKLCFVSSTHKSHQRKS